MYVYQMAIFIYFGITNQSVTYGQNLPKYFFPFSLHFSSSTLLYLSSLKMLIWKTKNSLLLSQRLIFCFFSLFHFGGFFGVAQMFSCECDAQIFVIENWIWCRFQLTRNIGFYVNTEWSMLHATNYCASEIMPSIFCCAFRQNKKKIQYLKCIKIMQPKSFVKWNLFVISTLLKYDQK